MPELTKNLFKHALELRGKLHERIPVIGAFVKTPSPHIVEVMALCGFDFLVLDAEHGPFDAQTLDLCMLAARAAGVPMMVRPSGVRDPMARAVLDMGAAGLVMPHVRSGDMAKEAASIVQFKLSERGLSPAPRAGGYGELNFTDYANSSDNALTLWAQIEDGIALGALDDIAQADGVDSLFVGRVDLAYALGQTSIEAPAVADGTKSAIKAALKAGKAAALFVNSHAEIKEFQDLGASIFVYGADQSLLKKAGREIVNDFRG